MSLESTPAEFFPCQPSGLFQGRETPPHAFFCRWRVGRSDLSRTIEHVSNVEYVRWLDRAAELHADSLGLTRPALLQQGAMWFVARHEIDYLAEAHLDDELVMATWVREFRRVRSWREYRIARMSDGQPVCRAATLWVLVDLAMRRPIEIPQAMKDAFLGLRPAST